MNKNSADLLTGFSLRLLRGSPPGSPPLIVGLNGPQGCGKTTLARELMARLETEGKRGIALSIDDFYLRRTEQIALAQRYPENPYLQQRGYPGTHDITLGNKILQALHIINDGKSAVHIPRYDKSLCGGQGDRAPEETWPEVAPPLDLVLLEGWMLGFTGVADTEMRDRFLHEPNEFLKAYQSWYTFLDAFVMIEAAEIKYTVDWRIEAEKNMRAQGKTGMSDGEIRSYIEKFLPAYQLYLPQLRHHPPLEAPVLHITIAQDRHPLEYHET